MPLHTKLSLSIVIGLILIVVIAQYVQYREAVRLVQALSGNILDTFENRERQAAQNLFGSVERSISGSLERGEMEKFTRLLEAQKEVQDLLELSLYNRQGMVTYSSHADLRGKKTLPAELYARLSSDPAQYLQQTNDAIEIYAPQVVERDCIRCHSHWNVGEICGVVNMRFSREALRESQTAAGKTIAAAQQTFFRNSLLVLGGIVIVFMGTMYFSVNGFVRRPIGHVIDGLRDISEGEGDLTRQLHILSQDEIGQLAQLFNAFLGKLRGMVQQIQQMGLQIASSSTQLAATTREQEITMQTQAESTEKIWNSVGEIASVTDQLVATMRGVAALEGDQHAILPGETTDLQRMEAAMQQMEQASMAISNQLAAINEKAENITQVVTAITKVAEQTNLLSLNASIEAEKAGEYGRGFTVVAREIRRLADQTAVSTLDIERMVHEMQTAVSSGVMAMDKFMTNVRHNVEDVRRISIKLTGIIQQVQELSPSFDQVNSAMTHLNEETQETRKALRETFGAIEQLNETAQGLQSEISRFKVN